MRWKPLAIISQKRYEELCAAERRLRRLSGIVMLVEHVNAKEGKTERHVLYRSPLNEIPEQIDYASGHGGMRQFRLFGVEPQFMTLSSGEAYDILFAEP